MNKYGVGILVFNPTDDEYHLERITTCITSCISSIENSKSQVKLNILLNNSYVEHLKLKGVGKKTREIINQITQSINFEFELFDIEYNNSMAYGYNFLLKNLYNDKSVSRIVIFADDYIIPKDWFAIIDSEFDKFPICDYITPSTSFVAQKNLLVPFQMQKHWVKNMVNEGKDFVGISKGITVSDVDMISKKCKHFPTIKHVGPPSFETTIFKRETLTKFGFLCEEYFFLFFNSEYFIRLKNGGALGIISRKAFVFHYGKGGTKSIFKGTGDEKFTDSPFEKYLINDINIFNKRNNKSAEIWWNNKSSKIESHPVNLKIIYYLIKYNIMSIIKNKYTYRLLNIIK